MPRADGVYNGGAGRNQVGTAEFAKECEVADGRVRQWVANDGDLPHTMRKGRNYFGDTSRAWWQRHARGNIDNKGGVREGG